VLRSYTVVLRTPGITTPFVASFLGAVAINMQALSVLLLIRDSTGSFGAAGAVAGALSLGAAAGLLLQGRLLDRYGQPAVLVPAGLICAGSLTALALVARTSAPVASLLALAAGASVPAVPSAMRVLCPDLLPDQRRRTSAYALLAIQLELSTVLGPLVVAGAVLLVDARVAVLATGLLAAGAALVYARAPASRRWRPTGTVRRPVQVGPGLRTLLGTALGVGAAAGLVAVGVPAVAVGHGAASLAGPLLAAAAIGGMLGGLVYGSRPWPAPLPTQLVLAQAGAATAAAGLLGCVLTLAATHPGALAPVLLLGGFAGAPIVIASSTLLDTVTDRQALTESYTMLVAATLVGIAAGTSAGGSLGEHVSTASVFGAAAAVLCGLTLLTLVRRRTLAG
jgi:predicted MFS family arabinose efflux permease